MTTGVRPFHDVCFLNLMTPQGEREKRFYADVLGWTYGEMAGVPGGSLVLVDGKVGGAVMDMDTQRFPAGTPPHIGILFKSESLEQSIADVRKLGGTAEAPMDVLENGRMVMCADPQGASFGLWQPKKQHGIDCDSRAHGAPSWFEDFSNDMKGSVAFYTRLFGWTGEASPSSGHPYTVLSLRGRPCAGAMQLEGQLKGMPAHWATTFTVRDVDAAVAKVKELGGKLHMGPAPIPDVGRFAAVASPAGVSFQVLEWSKGATR